MPRHYLGLCAIAKDETPFLREWAAYHHYVGFEKIYIYDNESRTPVRDSIADFYEIQICDSYTIPGKAMQLVAYNHCLAHHGHEFEWLAFFDLDEFLCLVQDKDARTLLRDYEQFPALSINWSIFSSSGKLGSPEGFVTENYTQHLGYSVNTKCIVRPAMVKMPFTAHHFLYRSGYAVNAMRQPSFGAYAPPAIDKIRLNHYPYKSQQDYEARLLRGDATYKGFNPRKLSKFYSQAQAAVAEERAILPMAAEARQILGQGTIRQRQDMRFSEAAALSLHRVLSTLAAFIRAQELDLAEVLFALCYRRFAQVKEFLRVGISLSGQCGKFERMEGLIHEYLTLEHDPEEERELFLSLLECRLLGGSTHAAQETANFLLEIAGITANADLKKKVQALLNKQHA
ncbi:MAG: glycosyltransferase family 2 protein [Desulfovibrionaceae bacterium]|nr:glycosyltransferase family 2 protein [Desulfovibrionaceae bacterium]